MRLTDSTIAVFSAGTERLYLCNLATGQQVYLSGRYARTVARRLTGRRGLARVDVAALRAAGMVL